VAWKATDLKREYAEIKAETEENQRAIQKIWMRLEPLERERKRKQESLKLELTMQEQAPAYHETLIKEEEKEE
jgi:hypothetical protein